MIAQPFLVYRPLWQNPKAGRARSARCYFEPLLQSGELVKSANAAAEQKRPGALRLLLSPCRLPDPKGPRRNNQSLTGAGPASAPECRVPGRINRPV